MEHISKIIEIYYIEIVLGLAVAFLLLLAFYIIAEIRISKLRDRYDKLTMGVDGANIEEILLENGKEISRIQENIGTINAEINNLDTRLKFAVQKIGFIRYNAFADMGSELSYSIVLLDEHLNGFVLTSIYGREQSVSYAKPIKDGKSTFPLSAEEMQAMDRAIKGELYTSSI
ncbi:MAG: DUF4446 family protein [Tissierellia bacterium]|nr:DUF4446 family protein [Tissierellia bacterium]